MVAIAAERASPGAALAVLGAVQWAAVECTSLAHLLGTVSLSPVARECVRVMVRRPFRGDVKPLPAQRSSILSQMPDRDFTVVPRKRVTRTHS
jgi:hypothetical protein